MQKIEKNQHSLVLKQLYFKALNNQIIIHVENLIYQGSIQDIDYEQNSITINRGTENTELPILSIDELYLVS